jgi:hypothetical protein
MSSFQSKVCALLLAAAVLMPIVTADAIGQCQRAKLTGDGGQADDRFGFAVAVSADLALVGAPGNDTRGENYGLAYVFERFGAPGTWLQVTTLPPSESSIPSNIGRSVAVDSDTALFGLHGGQSAYVFERSGHAWSEVAELVASEHWFGDFYGECVALDGDLAVVGAPHDDENGWRSGSAYVFERDPNGVWCQAAKLLADDGEPYNRFGYGVAIDGDVIAVGAPDDDDLGNYSGSAYVFERDPNGICSQTAKLLPHGGDVFWNFGESVAVSGQRVLVGATTAFAFAPAGGAAYVYERDPNGAWAEVAQLVSDDIANSDAFGGAVALSADIAVIGAWGDDDHGEQTGAAYVFVPQSQHTWLQVAKLVADDGAAYDRFGKSVALSGNTAVLGAYLDDDNGEDSGSAYVFAVGPDEDGDGIMDACLCPGDLDHDLDVDLSDLAQLLSNYGLTSGATYEDGDLDGDGDVDLTDLSALLAVYGTTCP